MRVIVFFGLAFTLAVMGCTRPQPDADIIVIGSGIAGLSAALEASAGGASVMVIEANSVGGGHAVKAGGFALVGTELQQKKGYRDTPEIAEQDLLAWGVDADPAWVHRYVQDSGTEVYDWLTGFGVRWGFILDTPEHSVPRFHFANGPALNVVVPMMRAAFTRTNLEFGWNTEATSLVRQRGAVRGVRVRNLRTGLEGEILAPVVIIATGGWQNDLAFVRREWHSTVPVPARLYSGAGQFATGSGIRLGQAAGASTLRMDHQAIFRNGLPDPRDTTGTRALLGENPSAIWVNSSGRRFISEIVASKVADETVLKQNPATHWLVFDADGLKTLRIRDAVWLGNPGGIEPLKTAGLIRQADSISALAAATGLPADALEKTVARWNAFVIAGNDAEFGRFTPGAPDPTAHDLRTAPFYALQLFPMARKSMGGLAIDAEARVLDAAGRPIPGLYAAGEVTGVAGINGSYGGEGTFLGPSVYLGRIAGAAAGGSRLKALLPPEKLDSRSAFRRDPDTSASSSADRRDPAVVPAPPKILVSTDPTSRATTITIPPATLPQLITASRPGYWHFEVSHRIVLERSLDCTACHTPDWPTVTPTSPAQRQIQLNSCSTCH